MIKQLFKPLTVDKEYSKLDNLNIKNYLYTFLITFSVTIIAVVAIIKVHRTFYEMIFGYLFTLSFFIYSSFYVYRRNKYGIIYRGSDLDITIRAIKDPYIQIATAIFFLVLSFLAYLLSTFRALSL